MRNIGSTLYTQARYLLDGVYARGSGLFPPLIRARKGFIQMGASSGLANVQAWRRAHQRTKLAPVQHSRQLIHQLTDELMRVDEDPRDVAVTSWDALAYELTRGK